MAVLLAQVELSLNIRCMSEGTLDVTSNDFMLDPQHPDVCPVGVPRHVMLLMEAHREALNQLHSVNRFSPMLSV